MPDVIHSLSHFLSFTLTHSLCGRPSAPPPLQWKHLVKDTELMDLLAPTDEDKKALIARDLEFSPEAAAARATRAADVSGAPAQS